ncbi:MAG: NADPH:quinone reductase-like Zn-dependent oxidoreductase, partial [Myxococcota bacterium]
MATMRAAQIEGFGPPEVLQLVEVERPTPGPRDLLVRIHATSVNPVDAKVRSGTNRAVLPPRLPWILGLDLSGVVEAVGSEVTEFAVGDAVYGSPTHKRPGT